MLAQINKWTPRIFQERVLHSARWGQALVIKFAYSARHAHLLSEKVTVPLEHAALTEAARHDRYNIIKVLIEKDLDLNGNCATKIGSIRRSDRRTREEQALYTNPLHNCVLWGSVRSAQLLLDNGADVNARTCGWGRTALFDAVGSPENKTIAPSREVLDSDKKLAMVRLLLDYGADVDIKSHRNESILYTAAREGHPEILDLLFKVGACTQLEHTQADGLTPLMAASRANHGAATRMLLEHGANLTTYINGLDAFALALKFGRATVDPTSTIEAFLDYDVDINISNHTLSPLSWAVYWNNLVGVKLLLAAGADARLPNSRNVTPLETWLDHPRKLSFLIFQELLEKGGDANWPMSNGNTLLIEACSPHGFYDRLPVIQTLIQHGADVNGRSDNGDTPLIMVCSTTSLGEALQIRIISELLKHQVNIELSNHQGDTALTKAINTGQDLRIVGMLLTCGADINKPNAKGETPLMSVCANKTLPQHRRLELCTLLGRISHRRIKQRDIAAQLNTQNND